MNDRNGVTWFAWHPIRTLSGWRWLTLVRKYWDGEEPYFRDL
jgi:hypothetical protein